MRWAIGVILFLLVFVIFGYSQSYVLEDEVKGLTSSSTAFAAAADRVHFASYYISTGNYSISKVVLFARINLGSPTMNFTATIYDNDNINSNPDSILGTSPDSVSATILSGGGFLSYNFTFDLAIPVTIGDTIWVGPSADAWNADNYINIERYTDLSGLTRKDNDQESWAAYLATPLAMEIYSTRVGYKNRFPIFPEGSVFPEN